MVNIIQRSSDVPPAADSPSDLTPIIKPSMTDTSQPTKNTPVRESNTLLVSVMLPVTIPSARNIAEPMLLGSKFARPTPSRYEVGDTELVIYNEKY